MRDRIVKTQEIKDVALALSSQTRLDIMNIIMERPMSVTEIAEKLDIPVSSAISAVLKLENAGLLNIELDGRKKICSVSYRNVVLQLKDSDTFNDKYNSVITYNVPIGDYSSYEAFPSCGLLGNRIFIGGLDNSECFKAEDRINASLVWMRKGFLNYSISTPAIKGKEVTSLSISFEICSEFPGYNNEFKSNIEFTINNQFIGIWTAPGDFGGRHGLFTPHWWNLNNTQFGDLVTICITGDGTFINKRQVSNITVKDVVNSSEILDFKIINKDSGGFNLFGRAFGDYDQDIIVRFNLTSNEKQKTKEPNKGFSEFDDWNTKDWNDYIQQSIKKHVTDNENGAE